MSKVKVFKPKGDIENIYSGGKLTEPNFKPSYYEWLRYRGTPLVQGGSVATAGTYSVYTVPDGYALFLTNAYLNISNPAARTQVILYISASTTQKLLSISCENGAAMSESISYPIPIQYDAGEQIILSFLSNSYVTQYGIIGFLVDKRDLQIV